MKKMNKLKLSRLFMMATIVLIAAFQSYWLIRLFHDEKERLKKTVDIAFRESIYKIREEKFRNDTLFFKGMPAPPPDVFMSDVVNDVSGSEKEIRESMPFKKRILSDDVPDDMHHHRNDSGNKKQMIIVRSFSSSGNNSSMKVEQFDSIVRSNTQKGRKVEVTTSGHNIFSTDSGITITAKNKKSLKFAFTIKDAIQNAHSINDTIPIKKIDSAFQKKLMSASAQNLVYVINKDTSYNEILTDTTHQLHTNPVRVGFIKPITYQAVFEDPFWLVIRKISPQIILSLLLILFTTISFVIIYRNLLAQRRLADMKDEFISNITHELKTPIATVTVAVEALRNFGGIQSAERTKEYLDISASELQRLSLLVDKVLKLSVFENKEIELKKEWFDCKQLVEDVINTMKLQFEKTNAQITFKTEGDTFLIEADKLHITSVIYNLFDNALKYSTRDPKIEVTLKSKAEHVELSVTDNGIGISDEYKEKIFDKFFRVPSGDHHNTKGYGLGLSYVSHITKRHQGFITVESEVSKGSTFTVFLPYKESEVIDFGAGRKITKKAFKL